MGSRKIAKKSVPKELASLFRVHDKKFPPPRDNREIKQSQKFGFRLGSLPPIPTPTAALSELLLEYGLLNEINWDTSSTKTAKSKKSKLKPINSFIAFRSFYSRSISNPEHQRELSSKLAELWTTDPNKEIWNQYTESYNNYLLSPGASMNFVDWLYDSLDIKVDNSIPMIEDISFDNYSQMFSGAIEDVYLIN
ncbi:MTLALPHA1 Mating-type-like protein ALPHA1 [Candida maltosa Xu316]